MFTDRQEAGTRLATQLLAFKNSRPAVLALPRGGVPVGLEIARSLAAPLDLVLVRKIGAPQQQELAVGAIADGAFPELVTDPEMIELLAVSSAYLDRAKATALKEVERRRGIYLGDRQAAEIAGRTAIVVDDGIATELTMLAALRVTRRRNPARLVLAVPVASRAALQRLRKEADEIVCLETPANFHAVGQFYRQFPQLQDAEVIALLNQAQTATERGGTAVAE